MVFMIENVETMKDFLVDKLKSAECVLKASISENVSLKKQASSDSEVWSLETCLLIFAVNHPYLSLDHMLFRSSSPRPWEPTNWNAATVQAISDEPESAHEHS